MEITSGAPNEFCLTGLLTKVYLNAKSYERATEKKYKCIYAESTQNTRPLGTYSTSFLEIDSAGEYEFGGVTVKTSQLLPEDEIQTLLHTCYVDKWTISMVNFAGLVPDREKTALSNSDIVIIDLKNQLVDVERVIKQLIGAEHQILIMSNLINEDKDMYKYQQELLKELGIQDIRELKSYKPQKVDSQTSMVILLRSN